MSTLANGCYYVFAMLTFIAAFKQLGVQFALLEQLILIAFSAAGDELWPLAFGLGGRDVMAGILSGYYIRQRLHAGDHVHVGDLEEHSSGSRPCGHDHRNRRRRTHEPPQHPQYQDALTKQSGKQHAVTSVDRSPESPTALRACTLIVTRQLAQGRIGIGPVFAPPGYNPAHAIDCYHQSKRRRGQSDHGHRQRLSATLAATGQRVAA